MKKRFLISLLVIGVMTFGITGCSSSEIKELTNSLDELGDALDEFGNTLEQIEENMTLENVYWVGVEENKNVGYVFKDGTLLITNGETKTTHEYTCTETTVTIDGETFEYTIENGYLTLDGKKFIYMLNDDTFEKMEDKQNTEVETKTTE